MTADLFISHGQAYNSLVLVNRIFSTNADIVFSSYHDQEYVLGFRRPTYTTVTTNAFLLTQLFAISCYFYRIRLDISFSACSMLFANNAV